MTPQVNIPSLTSRGIIAALRSPCAGNSLLKSGYSQHAPRQLGQVHLLPDREPVIVPGDGTVIRIASAINSWNDTAKSLAVTIDHGGHVTTLIQGLKNVQVVVGQFVTRGQVIGTPLTGEIFFQLFYHDSPLDPAAYSSTFRGFDGGKVLDKGHQLRGGPDFLVRPDSGTTSYLMGGVRYFVDEQCDVPPLLVNIDFNGSTKTGFAVVGLDSNDYWNPYVPVSFGSLSGDLCATLIAPKLDVDVGGLVDTSGGTVAWFSGSIFQTVIQVFGSDAASFTATWLDGSTENIPTIENSSMVDTFWAGTIINTVHQTSGTDSAGTQVVSFTIGTLFETIVYGLGTNFPAITPSVENAGTQSISFTIGTLFETIIYGLGTNSPSITPYTESGTQTDTFFNGTLFNVSVFGIGTNSPDPNPYVESAGTAVWSWLSGQIT